MREFLGVRGLALGTAAAMLVIGLFSWNLILQGEMRDLQEQAQRPQTPPDSRTVALKGPRVTHGARAEVMILHDKRAILMAEDMPQIPEEKTFQVWVIEDGVPKPSGLFEPKEKSVAVIVETPVGGADAIAVSVAPDHRPHTHGQALAGSPLRAFIHPHCRVYCRVEREVSVREKEDL